MHVCACARMQPFNKHSVNNTLADLVHFYVSAVPVATTGEIRRHGCREAIDTAVGLSVLSCSVS